MIDTTHPVSSSKPLSFQTESQSGVDLRGLRRILERRKFLISGIILGVVLAAWIGLSFLTPLYSSTVTLIVDSQGENPLRVAAASYANLTEVQDQIEILHSNDLMTQVAEALDLFHDPEFNPMLSKAQPAAAPRITDAARAIVINRLLDAVTVQVQGRSRIVAVSAVSADPAKAIRISTKLVELYLQYSLTGKERAARKAIEWMAQQSSELAGRADQAQAAILAFQEAHKQADDREINAATQQLNQIATSLALAQDQTAEHEARVRETEAEGGKGGSPAAGQNVVASPVIQSLKLQEADLNRQAAELTTRYGDLHPRVLQVRAQIMEIQRKIAGETAIIAANAKSEMDVALRHENNLRATRDALLARASDDNKTHAELARLQRQADSDRTLYETQYNRYKELQGQESGLEPDARILSSASFPDSPVYPRKSRVLAVAIAFSLLLAFGVVYTIEGMDNGLRSPEQLEAEIGLPCMAVIPFVSRRFSRRLLPEDAVLDQPKSAFRDLTQALLVNLGLFDDDAGRSTVLITSSVKGEGKSVVAVALGRLAAAHAENARVILVDCNLRQKKSYAGLSAPPGASLLDYLLGKAEIDTIIVKDARSGLDIILAGGPAINIPNLLNSPRMRQLMAELRRRYEIVFLDAPAVVGHVDNRILLQFATTTVFLIAWGQTPREVVIASLRQFAEGDTPVNIALSKVNLRRMAKYSAIGMAHQQAAQD